LILPISDGRRFPMTDARAVPIGDERVRTEETSAVTSPYDGRELARVPVCGPEHVDRAVTAARAALDEPLPPWRRAEILDNAACPVVLKPASQTPLSALDLAELLLDECGLPAGFLNVVTGGGGTVGNAIVEHSEVAYITFTGSAEVGWAIAEKAGRKKVALEL